MCVRPPCENCGADYDACFGVCPKCGHPNQYAPKWIPVPMKVIKKEVYCKVCQKNHVVERFERMELK